MKPFLFVSIFIFGGLLVGCGPSEGPLPISATLGAELSRHQGQGFNGSVLYSRNDSIHFIAHYGVTDYATNEKLNDSTRFDLASCSKQFTALCIVQLVEKGLLSYSTTVDSIIDSFPYPGVTIEHLLRHQSGLPDYMDLMYAPGVWDTTQIATNADVMGAMMQHRPPARSKPGTLFEYSNTGYLLLASIVERVSGRTFDDYLQTHVFQPAGMTHTRIYRRRYEGRKFPNTAEGFTFQPEKGTFIPVDDDPQGGLFYTLDGIVGDGTINSTLLDLIKWKDALRTNKLITGESKRLMFSPNEIADYYGFGFSLKGMQTGHKTVYHFGGWAGFATAIQYIPQTNEYFVVLCNNNYGPVQEVLERMVFITREFRGG